MTDNRVKSRRPPLGVVTGILGLAVSVAGYLNEVSGIALRSVLAAAIGTIATTAVGGMLAVGVTMQARRRWKHAAQASGRRAVEIVSEKPTTLARDARLHDDMSRLLRAAALDAADKAGVNVEDVSAALIVGNPDLPGASRTVRDTNVWLAGAWPTDLSERDLAEQCWPAVTSATPRIVSPKLTRRPERLLVVPLIGEADEPSLGAFVFRGLVNDELLHSHGHFGTEDAVSALLNWAKLATITLGRKQVPSGSGNDSEVASEASA